MAGTVTSMLEKARMSITVGNDEKLVGEIPIPPKSHPSDGKDEETDKVD